MPAVPSSNVPTASDWMQMMTFLLTGAYPNTGLPPGPPPAFNPALDPSSYAAWAENSARAKRKMAERFAQEELITCPIEESEEEALLPLPKKHQMIPSHALTPRQAAKDAQEKNRFIAYHVRLLRKELVRYDNDIAGRKEAMIKWADRVLSSLYGSDWELLAQYAPDSLVTPSNIYPSSSGLSYPYPPPVAGSKDAQGSNGIYQHTDYDNFGRPKSVAQKTASQSQMASSQSKQGSDESQKDTAGRQTQQRESKLASQADGIDSEDEFEAGLDAMAKEYFQKELMEALRLHQATQGKEGSNEGDVDCSRDVWGDNPYDRNPMDGQHPYPYDEGLYDDDLYGDYGGTMEEIMLAEKARLAGQAKKVSNNNTKKKKKGKKRTKATAKHNKKEAEVKMDGTKEIADRCVTQNNVQEGMSGTGGSKAFKLDTKSHAELSVSIPKAGLLRTSFGPPGSVYTPTTASVGLGLAGSALRYMKYSNSSPGTGASGSSKAELQCNGPPLKEPSDDLLEKSMVCTARMTAEAQQHHAIGSGGDKKIVFGKEPDNSFKLSCNVPAPRGLADAGKGGDNSNAATATAKAVVLSNKKQTTETSATEAKSLIAPATPKSIHDNLAYSGGGKRRKTNSDNSGESTALLPPGAGASSQPVKTMLSPASTLLPTTNPTTPPSSIQQAAKQPGGIAASSTSAHPKSQTEKEQPQRKTSQGPKGIKYQVVVFKKGFQPSKRPVRDCWHGREWL